MAHIQPNNISNTLPLVVVNTFNALKSLPDDYVIWAHLAPWQPEAPDFLILNANNRALLVKVSSAFKAQASNAAQMLLLADESRPALGAVEAQVLNQFLHPIGLPENSPIETLVVFPNIPHKLVLESRLKRQTGEPQWAGLEILQADGGLKWETFLPPQPLDRTCLEKIRQQFNPEIVVPAASTVRIPDQRRLEAGLTDYLLDYSQETAVKMDLEIESGGEDLSKDLRLNIINGVAGSGKTLILLYRLRLLYTLYPDKRYLVLTHNRPLANDLESRFTRLQGDTNQKIEWSTFLAWCRRHWPKDMEWNTPISMQTRKRLITKVQENHLKNTSVSAAMLQSEIDWLKDQLPMSREEYLTADRRGRGFGLSAELRQRVWSAMEAYQQTLAREEKLDWGDVPQLLWKWSEEGTITLPQYDVVLVDETQFFAPLWMRLIQKSLHPQNPHLFLVADPTQGFLGRKASWRSLGLQARGHTHALQRSYRTTYEIMRFATLFYRTRLPDDHDEDILTPDLLNMPNGATPIIIPLQSAQDEIARVANEVHTLLKNGCQRQHLLLLHANGQGAKSLIEAINRRVGKDAAMDAKQTYPGNYVRVTTLNAGAGLESPIVFLVGLRDLFEEEQSLRLSDEERESLIRENTRKIYMAVTRAGQRLVFTYVGDLPEMLRPLFGEQTNQS
ncbi:MAG: AAA family ATPase [Chloroflexi bacterium]|nr:AAA family ATPase [Chloroflexota bacterium]